MNPFAEKLDQLAAGEISSIEVSHAEFFLFREAWVIRPDKKQFRGVAGLKGSVTYYYDSIS